MIIIHGDEQHAIRPDGVMRTGVVRATGSFSPSANAYAVTQRFAASGHLGAARPSMWARLKFWLKSRPAPRGGRAIAPMTPVVSNAEFPSAPGNSLPASTAAPGYSGQSPDARQFSAMATYITSGFHPSLVPSVVEGPEQAAARLAPHKGAHPAALAAGVMHYAGDRVGQAAWQAAVRRFYAANKARIKY